MVHQNSEKSLRHARAKKTPDQRIAQLDRAMSPENDYIFCEIFGTDADCFKSLFCAVTGRDPLTIKSITFIGRDLKPDHPDAKGSIVDVKAVFCDGTCASIEMQCSAQGSYLLRALFYTAALCKSHGLTKAEAYSQLNDSITIHFTLQKIVKSSSTGLHCFFLVNKDLLDLAAKEMNPEKKSLIEKEAHALSQKFRIYIVELTKEFWDNMPEALKKWFLFLTKTYQSKDTLQEFRPFSKAYGILDKIQADPVKREIALAREKQLFDHRSAIYEAVTDTKEEAAMDAQIVKEQNIIALAEKGIPDGVIAEVWKCSVDEISSILQKYRALSK